MLKESYTSTIQFLSKTKVVKIILICFVGSMSVVTLFAMIHIPFHYAAVMPRSPQPETGRVYAIKAQYELIVYVNKKELDRRDFVEYKLMPITGVSAVLLFLLGTRCGWFRKNDRFGGNRRKRPDLRDDALR